MYVMTIFIYIEFVTFDLGLRDTLNTVTYRHKF